MTTHQHGEGGFVSTLDEAMHQVGIGQMRNSLGKQHTLKVPENGIWLAARHESCPLRRKTSRSSKS
jgi:hypothetical protein